MSKIKREVDFTGVPLMKELEKTPGFPTKRRLLRGPVAVIECLQEIPCNFCEDACPNGAISVGNPIINLPRLDEDKCVGCGKCIAFCPGLAIFVVDMTFSNTEARISFPYELLPIHKVGSVVDAVDREGKIITKGRVVDVIEREEFDRTLVVSIAVPKKFAQAVRGIASIKS